MSYIILRLRYYSCLLDYNDEIIYHYFQGLYPEIYIIGILKQMFKKSF